MFVTKRSVRESPGCDGIISPGAGVKIERLFAGGSLDSKNEETRRSTCRAILPGNRPLETERAGIKMIEGKECKNHTGLPWNSPR